MAARYPTSRQFRRLLAAQPLEEVVRNTLFLGVPYVFRSRPRVYENMREFLREKLSVSREDITVVGSARLGYSLAPETYGRRFRDESDVDVIVVSANLFDLAWVELLRWTLKRKWSMPKWKQERAIAHHLWSVYWGHIWPDQLAFSELGRAWSMTFRALSLDSDLAALTINARLYRTWDHAELYHVDSLRSLVRCS